METQDFKTSITAKVTASEAFKGITQVADWWAETLKGKSEKMGDTFKVTFKDTFVDFKITEANPDLKIVWLVTDCNIPWTEDKKEWNGTQIVFEISSESGTSTINFTHVGLVPEIECYDNCVKGWTFYINSSLLKLLTEGEGLPYKIAEEMQNQ